MSEKVRRTLPTARRELTTPIAHAYPLEEAADAHRHQEKADLRGKIVLTP
jgi:NADPH:quinone reductase-like Zn-dependent oxidoreductase